jgi:acetolactate synthase-1/2/3 large subunit
MKGTDYIAEFLARVGSSQVFVLTGGACAFMIDAVARHPALAYTCFHHEQSAAMAADAVWRVAQRVGVTMATSGPSATNLITGIACSFFDSIRPCTSQDRSTSAKVAPIVVRKWPIGLSGDEDCRDGSSNH